MTPDKMKSPPTGPHRKPIHRSSSLVHVVDDEDVVREGISLLLRSRAIASKCYSSAEDFECSLEEQPMNAGGSTRSPQALVLDLRMGGMSGMALFDRLVERGMTGFMPVIFLTGHGDVTTAVACIKKGAFDFVEKPFATNALVDKVLSALLASEKHLELHAEHERLAQAYARLTPRELEVTALAVQGKRTKEIARALDIDIRTVEAHRSNIFQKLSIDSALQLVDFAHRFEAMRK